MHSHVLHLHEHAYIHTCYIYTLACMHSRVVYVHEHTYIHVRHIYKSTHTVTCDIYTRAHITFTRATSGAMDPGAAFPRLQNTEYTTSYAL